MECRIENNQSVLWDASYRNSAQREFFAHVIKKNVGHELQVRLDQGAPVFLPSPGFAFLALVSLGGK